MDFGIEVQFSGIRNTSIPVSIPLILEFGIRVSSCDRRTHVDAGLGVMPEENYKDIIVDQDGHRMVALMSAFFLGSSGVYPGCWMLRPPI